MLTEGLWFILISELDQDEPSSEGDVKSKKEKEPTVLRP